MKAPSLRSSLGNSGFTMIEVIAVLILMAVLSAIALSRLGSASTYSLVAEADTLKVHLRYAQFRAMSDDATWGMSFGGNAYTLLRNGATASQDLPNENSPTHVLTGGITLTGSTISFDGWGSPGAADIAVTLSAGGESRTISIKKNTGFIQ